MPNFANRIVGALSSCPRRRALQQFRPISVERRPGQSSVSYRAAVDTSAGTDEPSRRGNEASSSAQSRMLHLPVFRAGRHRIACSSESTSNVLAFRAQPRALLTPSCSTGVEVLGCPGHPWPLRRQWSCGRRPPLAYVVVVVVSAVVPSREGTEQESKPRVEGRSPRVPDTLIGHHAGEPRNVAVQKKFLCLKLAGRIGRVLTILGQTSVRGGGRTLSSSRGELRPHFVSYCLTQERTPLLPFFASKSSTDAKLQIHPSTPALSTHLSKQAYFTPTCAVSSSPLRWRKIFDVTFEAGIVVKSLRSYSIRSNGLYYRTRQRKDPNVQADVFNFGQYVQLRSGTSRDVKDSHFESELIFRF